MGNCFESKNSSQKQQESKKVYPSNASS